MKTIINLLHSLNKRVNKVNSNINNLEITNISFLNDEYNLLLDNYDILTNRYKLQLNILNDMIYKFDNEFHNTFFDIYLKELINLINEIEFLYYQIIEIKKIILDLINYNSKFVYGIKNYNNQFNMIEISN